MIDTPLRKSRPRRALSILTALTVALGLGMPLPAAADAPSPSPTPTATDAAPTGTTSFTLAPLRNGILNAGETLTVSVTLHNDTTAGIAATPVTLALGTAPLAGRAELTAWLAGSSDVTTSAVATGTIDPVSAGEQQTTAILVPPETPELVELRPGVYPLEAAYDSPDGAVVSTSVIVVPAPDRPLSASFIVPITVDARADALLTASELERLTAPDGELTSQLEGVSGTSAILAVDPAIPAAIRVLGIAAPESATSWLESLEALGNTRFALQFGDADPAVQLEAGLSRPLEPTSFAASMTAADFPPVAEPTPTLPVAPTPAPTEPADPQAPVYPTVDDLVAIGTVRGTVYWPDAGSITRDAVAKLGALDDGAALTVVPSTATTAGAKGDAVGARAATGDAGLLVTDAEISRLLSQAAAIDESALRGSPLAAATGYLAFAAAADAPLLVALDRTTARSYIGIRTVLSAVADFPGVITQSLTSVAGTAAQAVELVDTEPPSERVAAASALFGDEDELGRFATILDDPGLLTGIERAEILQLLGVGWAARAGDFTTAVAEHRLATRETLGAVRLLPNKTINLFAAGAGLPFTVRNDLPYAVNLVLYASPNDLRLNVRRANDIVATPQSNTRVEVPVEARVGNGEVTLELQLRSPSFVAIGPSERVEVNVRAEWETVGLVALAVIVGGLLVLGVLRTILRARERRRGETPSSEDAP
ncbi:DUF6049 family protein [Microbacterium sp. NPDC055357]